MKTTVSLAVLLLLVCRGLSAAGPPPAATRLAGTPRFDKYDDYFRKYTKRFFGVGFDWRFFKAQAIVESNLIPDAKSSVGARGLMQLMPGTFADVRRAHSEFGDIDQPEWNIAAGIAFSRDLFTFWIKQADDQFQRHFMLGSYNAGQGTLMRAQKVALAQKLNHRVWPSIEQIASKVPNWRYSETLPYVTAVLTNLEALDREGRIEGPTVTRQDPSGRSLSEQLSRLKALKGVTTNVTKGAFQRLRSALRK